MIKLLTKPDSNPKLAKGLSRGVMTFALHLAPADLSGSQGCTRACLNTAGRGRFDDETDLRYLDPAGSVIALYAKGRGKSDTTGFVRDLADNDNQASYLTELENAA